ncbi:MAG TPA: L-histidine N(alpha)-methyltransferase [Candidatus Saccharimonadales bacterium]|nr:L-histidine N(alpha)-methyltransferase [Candidatus Saccharimonadales bacterium]
MLYFKKADLAQTYHVSEKTVTNWIREAKDGKLALELYEKQGRAWIANTTRNITLIEQLVEGRKKFRNSRGIKEITPKQQFYQLYNQQQIFDIASSLDTYHEIPLEYAYFDGGADYWDRYVERLATEEMPNFLTSTIKQLRTSQSYIDDLTSRYKRVNIIDIGPGNGLPVKELLQHLLDQGRLGRYIALDISPAILKLAKRRVQEWFGSKVRFEGHQIDINYDRFTQLLADEALSRDAKDVVNVILGLGGTFCNLRSPDDAFKAIRNSMNGYDLLVYNLKLDTKKTRQYFDLGVRAGSELASLDAHKKMLVDLLNIDESFYDVEMGYDDQQQKRYMRIRLKVALTITFIFENGSRVVELNKNDTILVWRYWHQGAQDVTKQLNRNDFDVLQTSLTEDKDYLLTISRVKSER